jgi:hypothetical protein
MKVAPKFPQGNGFGGMPDVWSHVPPAPELEPRLEILRAVAQYAVAPEGRGGAAITDEERAELVAIAAALGLSEHPDVVAFLEQA